MTVEQLRKRLPHYEIQNHPYDIGYWSRVAGLDRPQQGTKQQAGWDRADRELKGESVEEARQ